MENVHFDEFMRVLMENATEETAAAVDVLLRCASNIVDNPNEARYRRLKIGSREITEKLLPINGALECLFLAGFEEGNEYLVYPQSASLEPLQRLREALLKLRSELSRLSVSSTNACIAANVGGNNTKNSSSNSGPASWDDKKYPDNIMLLEAEFQKKILASCQLVQLYQDPALQQKARTAMPVEELHKRAEERLVHLQAGSSNGIAIDLMDCLLVELLAWFKQDFFTWFDAPNCSKCRSRMTGINDVVMTADEDDRRWGANRIEGYKCINSCNTTVRFPRYNNPEKLLQTRIGRCGEWANCFTLCCISLGFDARYVLDWTDHVWTEVHSTSQDRWLHCDPCENLCDSPLVYESGWNKSLSYVIAFSKDDIQDVTWRYSIRYIEVLSRRLLCRETWLLNLICSKRRQVQAVADSSRKTELDRRLVIELVEFLSPSKRTTKDNELSGRSSGSLDWRKARGEISGDLSSGGNPFTFELTDEEMTSKRFHLRYCTATDTYMRMIANETLRGWQNYVHSVSNVFRKVESDWKQVYLARVEGNDVGRISWKIVISGEDKDLFIKTVAIRCDSAVYENGTVVWKVCSRHLCVPIPNGSKTFVTDAIAGERELTIEAELSGGRGSVCWQHAQLFRLSVDDKDKFPLDVFITFD